MTPHPRGCQLGNATPSGVAKIFWGVPARPPPSPGNGRDHGWPATCKTVGMRLRSRPLLFARTLADFATTRPLLQALLEQRQAAREHERAAERITVAADAAESTAWRRIAA